VFGNNATAHDGGKAITTDSIGRILVAGYIRNAANNDMDMAIWRYNSDGTLDTTFNGQGWVVHHNAAGGNENDQATGIVIDSSNRILITGYSRNAAGNFDMVIWRYNSNGTFDTTFNGQGWIVHNGAAGGNGEDVGYGIALDSSGRILVTGNSMPATGNADMTIWRYNSNGTLDTTFNGQGWVTHNNAGGFSINSPDYGYAIVAHPSGILVAGISTGPSGNADMVIWRYNSNGVLDTNFNGQGWVIHGNAAGGNSFDYGWGIAYDGSWRIYVTGFSYNAAGNEDMVIWRYSWSGTLDTTFGSGGVVVVNNAAGGDNIDAGMGIVLSPNGTIFITGISVNSAGNEDMVIWKYTPSGILDSSFNSIGYVVHNNAAGGNLHDEGVAITLDSKGRVLVTGHSRNSAGNSDMTIWRYNP
jgi:uncharacterized delta-60 repeat protein